MRFLFFVLVFISTNSVWAQEHSSIQGDCANCKKDLGIRVRDGEVKTRIALPHLLKPGLSSLDEICEHAMQAKPYKRFAIVHLKTHACDLGGGECMDATREVNDPANAWIGENFSRYHMRVIETSSGQKRDFARELKERGFSCKGLMNCFKADPVPGSLILVDVEKCVNFSYVDDGRRVTVEGRAARLDALNSRLFAATSQYTIQQARDSIPEPVKLDAEWVNKVPLPDDADMLIQLDEQIKKEMDL
jgi:hypothetical protein